MPRMPASPSGPAKVRLQRFATTKPADAMAVLQRLRADLIAEGHPSEAVAARVDAEAAKWGLPPLPPLT